MKSHIYMTFHHNNRIVNPLSYNNGSAYTFTWDGRELASVVKGGVTTSYTYGADGLRTEKQYGSTTYNYYYVDGQLVRMTWANSYIGFLYDESGSVYSFVYDGDKIIREIRPNAVLRYFYDNIGVCGFRYSNNNYYFMRNMQGDITAIYDTNGNIMAEYVYDAWGNHTITTDIGGIGTLNPFRYRGYYFDMETGLYYVSSRYYDPEIGRWINADIPETLTADFENFAQYNLFAYCFNNPVNMSDETGTWPSWAKKVVAAVAVVAVVAAVAAVTVATAGAGTAAAIIAVGAAKGAAIGMASGAAIGAATGAVSHRVSTGSWSGAGTAALNGMGDGALSGAVTGAITGAAGSAVKVSQAAKAWDSGTFKSGYRSMKYHYNEHVVKEGLTKGNNVFKYTQDAVSFANRNSSALKYTYNYNYGNASWNLTYLNGQGGMFTSTGKILTFWYR